MAYGERIRLSLIKLWAPTKKHVQDIVQSDLDMTGTASFVSCFHHPDFFFLNDYIGFIMVIITILINFDCWL